MAMPTTVTMAAGAAKMAAAKSLTPVVSRVTLGLHAMTQAQSHRPVVNSGITGGPIGSKAHRDLLPTSLPVHLLLA